MEIDDGLISGLFVHLVRFQIFWILLFPIVLSYSLCATQSYTSSFCCSLFNRPHLPLACKQPKLSRQALSGLSTGSGSQISHIESAPISLNRLFSLEWSLAVGGLPSKICVVVAFFSSSACLARSSVGRCLFPPPHSPQSVSFPSGSSTSSSRTQSARRSTAPGAATHKSGECSEPSGTRLSSSRPSSDEVGVPWQSRRSDIIRPRA